MIEIRSAYDSFCHVALRDRQRKAKPVYGLCLYIISIACIKLGELFAK